jgi:hypothetical protein
MRMRYLVLALALAATVPACGSDGDKKTGSSNTAGSVVEPVSKEITAADGGTVEIEGGASLAIPAGALAEDTTITVETSNAASDAPEKSTIKSVIYDFGPDGTEFLEPAALTLPAPKLGENQVAVISWLDEEANAWTDLSTTVGDDGSVSADITHFTKFVVRFTDAAVDAGSCENFVACGGDVTGTWNLVGACVDTGVDNTGGECPEQTIDAQIDITGDIIIAADGTFTSELTTSGTVSFSLPASCLEAFAGSPDFTCDSLGDEGDAETQPTVCTGDPADTGCTCSQEQAIETDQGTGTWETDGNTFSTTDDDSTEPEVWEYCVKGNTVTLHQDTDDNGFSTTIIAQRK